ncbi:uncharacterized protein LOC118609979 [Rousettus aegyptiacus]|uniref:uncharacterized protein LOC118609979 n=1 Tax=Rousettus aegyptiacus TaxID=9407 RepID=UPI00168CCD53|nr:uncharacterized protein LOC118609979 [Rousettus aegyptiacus]
MFFEHLLCARQCFRCRSYNFESSEISAPGGRWERTKKRKPRHQEIEARRGRAPRSSPRGWSRNSNAGLPAPEHPRRDTCTHSRGSRLAPGTYHVLFHGLFCIAQRLHSDVCPASRSEARSALCREECSWWPRPGSEKKGSLVGESHSPMHEPCLELPSFSASPFVCPTTNQHGGDPGEPQRPPGASLGTADGLAGPGDLERKARLRGLIRSLM